MIWELDNLYFPGSIPQLNLDSYKLMIRYQKFLYLVPSQLILSPHLKITTPSLVDVIGS